MIRALEERGFVFEADDEGEAAGHMTNPSSPVLHPHRNGSSNPFGFPNLPGTPPPSTISELQQRTFRVLEKNNISPSLDPSIELVTCAGVKDSTARKSAAKFTLGKLTHGLVQCLTSLERPKFFSLTLTATDSASLTLERHLLDLFPFGGEDILLSKDGPEQVPITLDLTNLPLESTGIVCGVSNRLIEGMKGRVGYELFNMSYLSTTHAGHVIVYEDELADAMAALSGAEADGANGR